MEELWLKNSDKRILENIEYCNNISSELIWLLENHEWVIRLEYITKDVLYRIAKDLVHILEYEKQPEQLSIDNKEVFNERVKEYKKELSK